MKRKRPPAPDPVIPREILEQARRASETDRAKPSRLEKCVVCGADCAPNSTEGLCWVCRRLKISAWRDTDQQMSVQE